MLSLVGIVILPVIKFSVFHTKCKWNCPVKCRPGRGSAPTAGPAMREVGGFSGLMSRQMRPPSRC